MVTYCGDDFVLLDESSFRLDSFFFSLSRTFSSSATAVFVIVSSWPAIGGDGAVAIMVVMIVGSS